jgi:GT2 family glycosyltransferase
VTSNGGDSLAGEGGVYAAIGQRRRVPGVCLSTSGLRFGCRGHESHGPWIMTTLSIVIPSYNRRESLARLVSTLLEQDRADHKVEIVVVLDGSTDGSAETLAEVVVPPGMTLLIRQQPNRGPSAARNAGIADASGEIVLFLDDDMVPLPRFVKSHLEAYRDVQIDGVIGQIKSVSAPCVPPTVATLMENLFDDQHHRLSEEGAAVTAMDVFTGNLSVKRSRLLEVGGFDESLTGLAAEDRTLLPPTTAPSSHRSGDTGFGRRVPQTHD